MTSKINKQLSQLKTVPSLAHAHWVAITPKRTGNARRRTKLKGKSIHARYHYASELDAGASRQARKGMSKPTANFIAKLIKKIMR